MNSKLYIFALLFIAFNSSVYGQVILVDKALESLKNKDLQKAKQSIDAASKDATTGREPKTWYLKGFIYKELFKGNPSATEDFRETAIESASKSIVLDVKNTYTKDNQAVLTYLSTSYYNESIDDLNEENYKKALAGFEKCVKYTLSNKNEDIHKNALYYAGYAALQMNDLLKAKSYYEQVLALNYNHPALYEEMAILYQKEGNNALASKMIVSGRKNFPADPNLRIAEINLLLTQSQYTQAEKLVNDYLRIDSTNTDVLLVAGTLYGKLFQTDSTHTNKEGYFLKRKAVYQKVLHISPNNFMANYNMGITLYNRAVDLINPQTYDLDILAFHNLLETITELFKEALPYVEKATTLAPENKNALIALQGIYYNINEKEKFEQIKIKIESIK